MHKIFVHISYLTLCCIIISGCGKSAQDYFDQGMINFEQENYAKAISLFKKSLKIEPENVKTRFYFGKAHKLSGNHEKAIEAFKHVLDITPSDYYVLYDLADSYTLQGQYDQALNWIRNSLAVKPDFIDSHVLLGRTMTLDGQLDEAEKEFEFLIKVTRDDADSIQAYRDSLYYLSQLYVKKGDYRAAKKILKELNTTAPDSERAWFAYGVNASATGDMNQLKTAADQLDRLGSPLGKDLRARLK